MTPRDKATEKLLLRNALIQVVCSGVIVVSLLVYWLLQR